MKYTKFKFYLRLIEVFTSNVLYYAVTFMRYSVANEFSCDFK